MANIILTSAGRRNYLVEYFKSALSGTGKVYTANSTKDATAMLVSDGAFVAPMLDDPEYIPFLLKVCTKYSITIIVPLFDLELPILAPAIDQFQDIGVTVFVSDIDIIKICNDKWETFRFLRNHGFNSPSTFLSIAETLDSIEHNKCSFPLMIKPRWGMGSIATNVAENPKELEVLFAMVKRNMMKTYLNKNSKKDLNQSIVIQRFLEGDEFGLDVVNNLNESFIVSFVKKKLSMRAGETDSAETVNDPELEQLGKDISCKLKHCGNLDVDVMRSGGKPYIIDMNARIGGGYPFSHLAGADIPAAYVAWASNQRPASECFKIKIGVRGFKALQPILQDLSNRIDL